jgi:hypothetical protein
VSKAEAMKLIELADVVLVEVGLVIKTAGSTARAVAPIKTSASAKKKRPVFMDE